MLVPTSLIKSARGRIVGPDFESERRASEAARRRFGRGKKTCADAPASRRRGYRDRVETRDAAARTKEHNERMEEFRILSDKVRDLNTGIGQFRDDPAALEAQLTSLLEDLDKLRLSARNSRMRSLEKHAESLGQALQAARKKLEKLLKGFG